MHHWVDQTAPDGYRDADMYRHGGNIYMMQHISSIRAYVNARIETHLSLGLNVTQQMIHGWWSDAFAEKKREQELDARNRREQARAQAVAQRQEYWRGMAPKILLGLKTDIRRRSRRELWASFKPVAESAWNCLRQESPFIQTGLAAFVVFLVYRIVT